MKKFTTILLALMLVMGMSVPAFAENETAKQTDLSFMLPPSAPVYTVTIPGSLVLEAGDNYLPIEVSDTANFSGKSVVVTFEGTQYLVAGNYWTILGEPDGSGISYILKDSDNNLLPSWRPTNFSDSIYAPLNHSTLATFNGNGTKYINLELKEYELEEVIPDVEYTGYIRFGIKLV